MENLDLALAFDQNFLVPLYALLTSIFYNNLGIRFRFHVIATGVSSGEKQEITRYITLQKSTVAFYTISPQSLQNIVIPQNRHYTVATYYRLFFPQLVPTAVKKLLYLDTDVILNGSLKELYATEMGSFPAAFVREKASTERPELGIYEKGACFNAGVMLINLPEWRRQKVTEKTMEFILSFPERIKFADQDGLNVVLKDNYIPLDRKYNVCFYDVPRNRTIKQYRSFIKDKVIIHYTLTHKPWNALGKNRLKFLYFEYLKRSPKAQSKRYLNFYPTAKNILKFLKLQTQEAICNYFPFLASRLSKHYLWNKG